MKIQVISLLLVASSALAQMNSMEQVPPVSSSSTSTPTTATLDRRTLVGDEYTVTNQIDNSRGKQTFSIDHNGDSSVHKGLLYDLVDPSMVESRFFRRSLLGDLLGGDRTTIENVNDNSQHHQTMNSHGNKNVKITKVHKEWDSGHGGDMSPESFFDKRSLLGDLLGGDSTSISNVNDNSKHSQTMNSHGNKNVKITKVHKEWDSGHGGDMSPESFFDKRSLLGDLLGGDSTSISNVNDNSKHSQTMNSHGNKNVKITKVHKEWDSGHGGDISPESFFDKRSLLGDLLGGDSTSISNVNDNSKHSQTMNSHGNKNIKTTKVHKEHRTGGHGNMSPEAFFDKRSLLGDLLGGDSTSISNVNDNSKHSQTMNSHGNKNIKTTKVNKEHRTRGHGNMSPEAFFDKRSLLGDLVGSDSTLVSNVNDNSKRAQTMNSRGNRHSSETHIHKEVRDREGHVMATKDIHLGRRGLLLGGKSTSISNVNDNSQETKTLNSHGNTDVTKSHTDYRHQSGRGRRHGDMYRRGLLLGGDVLQVTNENYNGQESKTLNVHDNVDKTVIYQNIAGEDEGEGEEGEEMLDLAKRDSIAVSNVNNNSRTTKTINSYSNVYYQGERRGAKKAPRHKKGGPRRMDA